jgi:hypothetical protein
MAVVHTSPAIEERHVVHHDSDASSSGMIAIVFIVALLLIGFFLAMSGALPFGANTGSDINVDLPNVTTPDVTPDVNVNNENNLPNTTE